LYDATRRLKLKAGDVALNLSDTDLDNVVEKALDEPIEKACETEDRMAKVAKKSSELVAIICCIFVFK
jgi:hypothetical protein